MQKATCLTDDQRWQSVLACDHRRRRSFSPCVFTVSFAVRLAAPDMLCGKTSPSTQMPVRHSPLAFAPANAVSQTKPIPGNIGWIKSPSACRLLEQETPVTLEALADQVAMSPFHLHRLFKATTGIRSKPGNRPGARLAVCARNRWRKGRA